MNSPAEAGLAALTHQVVEERAKTPPARGASSVVSPPSKAPQRAAASATSEHGFDAQLALLSKRSKSDPPRARRPQLPGMKKRRSGVPIIALLAVLGVAAAIGFELTLGKRTWLGRSSEPVAAQVTIASTAPLLAIDRAQVAPNEGLAEPPASALVPPAAADPKPIGTAPTPRERAEPRGIAADAELETPEEAEPPPPVAAAFDADAAERAIDGAAALAQSCKAADDPEGVAVVIITFAPSGRATTATVSGEPFAGTKVGSCIAAKFGAASVPPYQGDFITVKKSFPVKNAVPTKK